MNGPGTRLATSALARWVAYPVVFMTLFYLPMCRGDIPQGGMKIKDALKEVLRNALINDGLARGLREAVKTLDK